MGPNATRRMIYRAAGLFGLNHGARVCWGRHLLVLAYHGVCGHAPDVPDPLGQQVPARLFEAQIRFLVRHYRPVSLTQVRAHYWQDAPLPPAAVLLTFDDAYRNVARNALPLLRQLGVPSVLFPVAGPVEADTWLWPSQLNVQRGADPGLAELRRWLKALSVVERRRWLEEKGVARVKSHAECDYSLMGWEELGVEMRAGGVEIGSHGLEHEPLTTCDPAELSTELIASRRLIRERLNVDATAVAYPNGDYSPAVTAAARDAGYGIGFTTVARHARREDDPLALPRILVGPEKPSVLAARLAGWQEWLRAMNGG